MSLDSMNPNPLWVASGHKKTIDVFKKLEDNFIFRIWGDDGCKDCRDQLPEFASVLHAAGVDNSRIKQHLVERLPEGKKKGELVSEYSISRIPTIVIEQEPDEVSKDKKFTPIELARYVECEDIPAADYLAHLIIFHLPKQDKIL